MNKLSKCCNFCKIFDKIYQHDIDKPFAANNDYVAIASIGAIVEGWSLIIPRQHIFSMKDCYNDPAFYSIFTQVTSRIVENYGSVIVFEHGSSYEGSVTACGTNHAHIHVVPFSGIIIEKALSQTEMEWERSFASEISHRVNSQEYLFFSDLKSNFNFNDQIGFLHILKKPTSQFFRKIIANSLNCSAYFNYKEYPLLDIAKKTHNKLISAVM